MKGGGLTWAGWLAVGIGSMLVYSGMTGQSLVAELQGVLTGKGLVKGVDVAPATVGSSGGTGLVGGTAGGGAGGGGGSSWNGGAPTPPASPRVPAPAGVVRYPLVPLPSPSGSW